MKKYMLILAAMFVIGAGNACYSDSMKLNQRDGWQNIDNQKLVQLVKQFKDAVYNKDTKKANGLAATIKSQYPELEGHGFAVYADAMGLFSKQKYLKAAEKYYKLLDEYPSSSLYEAGLEGLYDIAVSLIGGQRVKRLGFLKLRSYEDGAIIMQEIADRVGDGPMAKRSLLTLAKSFEKRGEFLEAYQVWADISGRWPSGEMGRESLLGMARTLHSAYKGPKYSATSLDSAKSYYKDVKLRHPELADEIDAQNHIDLVEQQKAYKEYNIGNYYAKVGQKEPAKIYYDYVIGKWPKSAAAQLSKKKLIELGKDKPVKRRMFDWWFNAKKTALWRTSQTG